MPHHEYLILGGGMSADAAAHGIHEIDQAGSIGVLSSEPSAPYNRPPLSKGLWKGGKLGDVWRNTEAVSGLTLHLQTTAVGVNPALECLGEGRCRPSRDKLRPRVHYG